MSNAKRDDNRVPSLLAVSDADGTTVIPLQADATTKRLKVAAVMSGGGTGDVNGPASSTDNAVARFDGITGKLLQDSIVTISDTGVVAGSSISGATNTITNIPLGTAVTGQLPLANGGTGANLVDPNADRLMFWDDSAGAVDWLTLGTNLSITGTTLNASGGGGGGTPGGSDTQVQYNNAGSFGGITGATTNGTALTLVAPILGTPASGTLTNCTGLPISSGVSGLGANVATFLATPSSANLKAAVTDETGSGALVFADTPTLVTPVLGVAAATSINKVAITAPATSATLTLADGSTLATSGAFSTTLTATGATNVTLPTTGTLATLAGAETLSSKTLTAPKFADLGYIADANGNELIIMDTVASAVNEITLANAATGNDVTISVTGGDSNVGLKLSPKGTGSVYGNQEVMVVAISDETTAITTGTAKVTFHMPYAFNLMKVKAGLSTASSSGNPAFDLNDDGVSVFTTTVTIDANETFSDTAATPSALTSTPLAIASGSVMTIDIDTAGTGAKGAKIYLIGYATAKP